jgi:hypothetical protein
MVKHDDNIFLTNYGCGPQLVLFNSVLLGEGDEDGSDVSLGSARNLRRLYVRR